MKCNTKKKCNYRVEHELWREVDWRQECKSIVGGTLQEVGEEQMDSKGSGSQKNRKNVPTLH